ncbi:hypothetical protein SELSPUOL_02081 [Selenomonas sputigena ATCC 35185]|uniref:Uncharacterized protein n=1 Tax=Selenomonas sputigena (strain ATCC 35185 / DSM 20758 / CCUG 44933 / VPI D19B-28) TaxID=546271 RepID=C9LX78_SELS3|nr:hypothetical protein SELSPUOL_02081 [Selenomonas sputigena ATCC 35185]
MLGADAFEKLAKPMQIFWQIVQYSNIHRITSSSYSREIPADLQAWISLLCVHTILSAFVTTFLDLSYKCEKIEKIRSLVLMKEII